MRDLGRLVSMIPALEDVKKGRKPPSLSSISRIPAKIEIIVHCARALDHTLFTHPFRQVEN